MAYRGISCFAGLSDKFPVKKVLNSYPKDVQNPATAILYGHFGDNWTFVERFCKKFADRPNLIEWHLCFRNALPIKELKRRTRVILKKMGKISPKTEVLICPVLEDACTNAEFKAIANELKKTFSGIKLVRNPCMKGNVVRPYDFEERHGTNPKFTKKRKRRIYNPDGVSVDFEDGDKYFNRMSVSQFVRVVKDPKLALWLIWYAPLQGFKDCKSFADKPPVDKRKYRLSNKASAGMNKILSKN